MEHAKRIAVNRELRQQIKHEQGCRCGFCSRQFSTHDLFIHHKVPVSHHEKGQGEQANCRHNLVGVCAECHNLLDYYALEKRVYFDDLIEMKERMEYILSPRKD